MPSLTITTRQAKSGPRYAVRYRLGGRAYPLVHGGSFKTLKEAKQRRDLIAGELAAGRNPADTLRAMVEKPPATTLARWVEKFLASRLDIDANTKRNYRVALKKVCATFGDRDPASLGADDVAAWVAGLAATHKPGTVRLYVTAFRVLLDFVGLDPNPARDHRVKLPKRVREEPSPPPAEHVEAIFAAL